MVKIKICGITNSKDAIEAVNLGVDAVGFVFFKNSPRVVTREQTLEIAKVISSFTMKVGVFVDEEEAEVKKIIEACNLDILQFHGKESPGYCKKFKGKKVIKAFRIKDKESLSPIRDYDVDMYLLDTHIEGKHGGTGIAFDWDLALSVKECGKPIILSGGLDADNVITAIEKVAPYGVDVSSGVESYPGKKNHRFMEEFVRKVRQCKE